eukprot:5448934-Ditylum_brightwellii.AAC.1
MLYIKHAVDIDGTGMIAPLFSFGDGLLSTGRRQDMVLLSGIWITNYLITGHSYTYTQTQAKESYSNPRWKTCCIEDKGENNIQTVYDPYARIDFYLPASDGSVKRVRTWWNRCLIGFKLPPYIAVRGFLWGEEILRGDQHDEHNYLHWDQIAFNLPCSVTYDP